MKKIMVVFGTRPEAIKMCPLVKELEARKCFDVFVCVSGQHKEMLQQVLDVFSISPKYNLGIMKQNQDLFDITSGVLNSIKDILLKEKPDIVLVHGDTSTSFAAGLACFYLGIPVGHVEAGLRTYNLLSPFPEEFNRQAVGIFASYNFAPTIFAKKNLLKEGKSEKTIFVTGNTVIDSMNFTTGLPYSNELNEKINNRHILFITAHRRENLGSKLRSMLLGIRKFLDSNPSFVGVYPVHLNPAVRDVAYEVFANCDNILLIDPIDVVSCHHLIKSSFVVVTDSGGIQEEASGLGVPTLVMRDTTERPEGIETGILRLVGTDGEEIFRNLETLSKNRSEYLKMVNSKNPYGDGYACKRIADVLQFGSCKEFN